MVDPRYEGGWKNVKRDCMLCKMEKKTEWHLETKDFVIADTLSGSPFIVSKHHEKELSDERRKRAERLVSLLYDDCDIDVRMGMVPNHWHGHITDGNTNLSNE